MVLPVSRSPDRLFRPCAKHAACQVLLVAQESADMCRRHVSCPICFDQAMERVAAREALRDEKRRSARAVEGLGELPANRGALFDDTDKGPLVSVCPCLPRGGVSEFQVHTLYESCCTCLPAFRS